MKQIDKVLAFADKCGSAANVAKKVGRLGSADVYGLSLVDTSGFNLPTGLPDFVLVDGKTFSYVDGENAFKIISLLDK
jgi:hypothetical protein